jgi:hypothetical protein
LPTKFFDEVEGAFIINEPQLLPQNTNQSMYEEVEQSTMSQWELSEESYKFSGWNILLFTFNNQSSTKYVYMNS